MPSLQIRKLPENIYKALKTAAKKERRSLSQQAIVALSKGLDVPIDFHDRREEVIKEILRKQNVLNKWANINVAEWIREDRDR